MRSIKGRWRPIILTAVISAAISSGTTQAINVAISAAAMVYSRYVATDARQIEAVVKTRRE